MILATRGQIVVRKSVGNVSNIVIIAAVCENNKIVVTLQSASINAVTGVAQAAVRALDPAPAPRPPARAFATPRCYGEDTLIVLWPVSQVPD